MEESKTITYPNEFNDEIDFQELFYVLFQGKWIIISITTILSIVGVIFSLSLPNLYESKAILVPSSSSNIYGSSGSYESIAGFAGINFSPSDQNKNATNAKKKITSLSFFENNILPNIFLPDLMAVKFWNPKTNTITFDENLYNSNNNTWIRDFSYPKKQIPSPQESYEVFKTKHLILNEDKKSGFITLSIKHKSPYISKQWIELIVNEVNEYYRQKDKLSSEKAINYLNEKISMTALSEINQALAMLLQEETKKLTLVEANKFYVFDYIDPPAVMEKKSEPNRAIICVLSAILGLMLSVLYVLSRHYVFSKKTF